MISVVHRVVPGPPVAAIWVAVGKAMRLRISANEFQLKDLGPKNPTESTDPAGSFRRLSDGARARIRTNWSEVQA